MTLLLHCKLPLPPDYAAADILAYHLRDPEHGSERGGPNRLEKAFVYQGIPSLLTLDVTPAYVQASWALHGANAAENATPLLARPALQNQLEQVVTRMMGFQQDVQAFEQTYGQHPELGTLIQRQRGLRVAATASPFEALSWAIIGQQISVKAAVAIRRRLIQATGAQPLNGLWGHPDAPMLAQQTLSRLQQAGLSQTKASTLQNVSRMVADGTLPLDDWSSTHSPDWQACREALLALRGIGPWTANYTLLRGYGWLDGSLHGDVAVRRALARLLGSDAPVTPAFTEQWLQGFRPWRALVGAHLWATNRLQA